MSENLSDEDFNSQFNTIQVIVASAAGISIFCTWLSSQLFRGCASLMAKEMRYDLYLTYFKKGLRMKDPIDAQ